MARNSFDDDDDLDNMINEVLNSDRQEKPKAREALKMSFDFLDEKPKAAEEPDRLGSSLLSDPLGKSARSDFEFPRERETVPSLMSTAPPAPSGPSASKRSAPKKGIFDDDDDPLELLEGGPSRTKGKQQKNPAQQLSAPPTAAAAAGPQQSSRTNLDWLFSANQPATASNAGSTPNVHADSGELSRPGSASKRRSEISDPAAADADGSSFLSAYMPSGVKQTGTSSALDFSASLGFEKKPSFPESPARQKPDVEKLDTRKAPVDIQVENKPQSSGLFDIFGGAETTTNAPSFSDSIRDKRHLTQTDSFDFDAKPAAKESDAKPASKFDLDSFLGDGPSQRGPQAGGKPPAATPVVASRKNSVARDSPKIVVTDRDQPTSTEVEKLRFENKQLATQIETIRRQTDAELRSLKEIQASELEQLRNSYESKLRLVKEQLSDRDRLIEERARIFSEQLADRDRLFNEEINRLRSERAEQKARFDERAAELEAARAAAIERERSSRSVLEKEIESANRSLSDGFARAIESGLNEVKRSFADHDLAKVVELLSRNTAELSRLASRSADLDRAGELTDKENRLRKLETQLNERSREADETESRLRKITDRLATERETEMARINEDRVRISTERQLLDRAKEAFENERRAAERQLESANKETERMRSDAKVELGNERAALAQLREALQNERVKIENDKAGLADLRNQELLKLTEQRNNELSRLKQVELELRSRTEMLKTDEEKLKGFQAALAQKENELVLELQRIDGLQKTMRSRENELEIRERQSESRSEQLERARLEIASQKQQAAAEMEELRRARLEHEKRSEAARRAELELKVAEQKLVEERVAIGAQLRELESKRNSFVCQACRQPVRDMIGQHASTDVRVMDAFAEDPYGKYMPREAAGLDAIANARQLRMRLDNDAAVRSFLFEAEQDQRFLDEERVFLEGIKNLRHF